MTRRSSVPVRSAITITAGTALAADHAAAQVGAAFALDDLGCVLLRGASIARHLYPKGEVRGYVDADLLIAFDTRARAETVLRELGFVDVTPLGRRPDDRPAWAGTWWRARDGGNVDLHWTIVGARADPQLVWSVLSSETEPMEVLGTVLEGLNAQATALVVALHAAHHGARVQNPLDDLRRALATFPDATWQQALALAERLAAVEAFASGLRLLEPGVELAARLDLPDSASVETILRAGTAPPMALGFDWLAQIPGLRAKLRLVAGKIVPDTAFMRAWSPFARGGSRAGLAVAYAWRPIWLLLHAGPALLAWLEARRSARK